METILVSTGTVCGRLLLLENTQNPLQKNNLEIISMDKANGS